MPANIIWKSFVCPPAAPAVTLGPNPSTFSLQKLEQGHSTSHRPAHTQHPWWPLAMATLPAQAMLVLLPLGVRERARHRHRTSAINEHNLGLSPSEATGPVPGGLEGLYETGQSNVAPFKCRTTTKCDNHCASPGHQPGQGRQWDCEGESPACPLAPVGILTGTSE